MLLPSLLLLPLSALAAPTLQQAPFAITGSPIPGIHWDAFSNHTLIPLNDGNFVPSPAFGVGSVWKGQNVTQLVLSALQSGYRHLDNSPFYGNEEFVGDAVRASGIPREDLYITTKFDHVDDEDVEVEFQKSLDKLGVAYVDLLLIHFPFVAAHDPAGVWASFESLHSRNLVRSIGVSNYDVRSLKALLALPDRTVTPVINQIKYHPYVQLQQAAVIELADEEGIRTAAYSTLTPLTSETGGAVDKVLTKIAEEEGITEGQVILDWVKGQGIAVVTTSGKEDHRREQLAVFGKDFPSLSKAGAKELEKAGQKHELKKGRPDHQCV